MLVGDSGETDPEVYGEIARKYADQVRHIFIRSVLGAENEDERFKTAFAGLPEDRWTVFLKADEIRTLPKPPTLGRGF